MMLWLPMYIIGLLWGFCSGFAFGALWLGHKMGFRGLTIQLHRTPPDILPPRR